MVKFPLRRMFIMSGDQQCFVEREKGGGGKIIGVGVTVIKVRALLGFFIII